MKRIAIFSLIALLAACNSTAPSKQEQLDNLKKQRDKITVQIDQLQVALDSSSANAKTVPVHLLTVKSSLFKNYIEVQGRVDADKNVTVTAEAAAVITGIYVHTGQRVSAGQTLAQLDAKVINDQIAQLQSQLDYAKNIYDRQQNLWDQNIGTKVQLLTAQNNYDNVKKQLAVQKSQLEMYRIKTPISGIVDDVIAKIGQAVSPGVPTFRVVNTNDLKVTGQIGENHISKVHTGDAVDVVLPDLADTLHTKLSYVSKVVDPSSRAFNVEIRLPHKSIYHPNMLAVIRVESYKNEHSLAVPVSVIQHGSEGTYVYLSDNKRAKRVPVTLGQTYGGYVEVDKGLKAGDELITAGFDNLNEGDSVAAE